MEAQLAPERAGGRTFLVEGTGRKVTLGWERTLSMEGQKVCQCGCGAREVSRKKCE